MAVDSTSSRMEAVLEAETQTNGSGVRVVGRRIFDNQFGKTCHQCRQKTANFAAACNNLKKGKQCPIKYCHKCLLNRYGEKAEDVALLVDWKCPKCRDICNCSFCMKKKGHRPTGILVHTAKATGYSSVSELLQAKGPENFGYKEIVKDIGASPKKQVVSMKESMPTSPRKLGKENSLDRDCVIVVESQNLASFSDKKKSKKLEREGLKELSNSIGDHEASLMKNSAKEPEMLNEASTKKIKGGKKNNDSVSDKKHYKMAVHMDGPSSPRKVEDTKCANGKKVRVSDDVKIAERSAKKRERTISDEGSTKKRKSKEKSVVDYFLEERILVPESKSFSPVRNKTNGAESKYPGGLHGSENGTTRAELYSCVAPCKDNSFATLLCDKKFDMSIQLPQGTSLTSIAGVELAPKDVGHALQFLEFCAAFGEVLDLKKGQAESIIREIIRGRGRCRLQYSPVVQIHMQLLSLIEKDMGKRFPSLRTSGNSSWFRALGQCVSESQCAVEEIPSDYYDSSVDAYYTLDSSAKLKLLNFLCDEALCTLTMRNWIDKQNFEFIDREKEAKEKILAARDKEKQLRQKMQDEIAKAVSEKNGANLSVSEYETLTGQIKKEANVAHRDVLEALSMLPKKRQRSDAVRTAPVIMDVDGHVFWRLRGYTSKMYILLQDIGTLDPVAADEKWFAYDIEQKREVEKYISSLRTKKIRTKKVSDSLPIDDVETNL